MSERTPATSNSASWVGEYRLLTKIGEGGMGVVHLAQAPDGRRVALKVLRPHIIGDDEARERLAREVSSLRRVQSPRIAEIVDADPWGRTPYVATRYVPGLSLHEHIRQEGPIAGEDLRWFAAALVEAVVAVHSVGVLHRDIKPSNILLEGRAPVLIDFGLARLAEDPRLTMTGWLFGTPGYLAPEILYGDDATVASDVHSWAATVVFAATGRPPFGSGPAMAVMDRVRRGEHELSGVPDDLLPLIRRCLSPDPVDRPDTGVVLADLRAPKAAQQTVADSDPDGSGAMTMPFALFATEDDDPTDVAVDGAEDPTVAQPRVTASPPAPATRSFTQPTPQAELASPPHEASRSPYMTPPPPQRQPHSQPEPDGRAAEPGTAKGQRAAVFLALLALVAVGFALAPYVALVLLAATVLVVRTISWITESALDRTYRRGRRRWYDGTLTALSSPWYLLVATGGTILLVLSSVVTTSLLGLVYLLFGLPTIPGLLLMGLVLGLATWWGPGSRRLRVPTRRLVLRASRRSEIGWVALGLLVLGIVLCAFSLFTAGVNWHPQPGPPWRPGTMLAEVVGVL